MDTVVQTLAPSSLPVLHGFLPDVAGGTTRLTEGSYPRSITSTPGTSLSENSRLPSWTWAYHGALLPITRASRTLDDFTHQGRSSSRGLLSFRVFLDRPPWDYHPLMRFGPAAGFFCGQRWTSGEGCPPLLKFLPSDLCFR
jgi:hypothetical protein